MGRILPSLLFIGIIFINLFFPSSVFAQPAPASPETPTVQDGTWVADSEVTFVGKTAARAGSFLDWTLENYNWSVVPSGKENPLLPFWATIRNLVYALLALVVLATAFILIITRGQSITLRRVLPKFLIIVLLVTFSFALIRFIYQVIDIFQGFFLANPDPCSGAGCSKFISQKNLLNIAFNYKEFSGYRLSGFINDESSFITLLLVKFTAVTYYVMTGILLLRKIILWFFIIISPVFPLLLIFYPIRNTAKIWIGEFFRWLLYAPLFAIFLSGLVSIWRIFIPLTFNFVDVEKQQSIYPTATNILIGGPGQILSLANSVNINDTFSQYIVALLMLWVVILLPFILLHIFLDYFLSFSLSESTVLRQILSTQSFLKGGSPSRPQPPLPSSYQPAGMARAIPIVNKISMPNIKYQGIPKAANVKNTQVSEISRLTNLSVPTMRDIVRYETNFLSSDTTKHEEAVRVHETLERIANPSLVTTPAERMHYQKVKENLVMAQQKGNPMASSVLLASQTVTKGPVSAAAGAVGAGAAPGVLGGISGGKSPFPVVNRIQTVSLEDYETVRKMWIDNYQNLETPKDIEGKQKSRKDWVKGDIEKINETINLLLSQDPQKVAQGKTMVAKVLPFLLIGGFSQTEIIAYLKAKLEAGKSVLSEAEKQQEEEETQISVKEKKEEKPKEAHLEAEVTEEKPEAPIDYSDEKKDNNIS